MYMKVFLIQRNCVFAVRIYFSQLETFLGLICIQFKFSMCTPACFESKLFVRIPWKASCHLRSEHMLVVVVRVTCSVHYQKWCLLSAECQLCCTGARHPPSECWTSLLTAAVSAWQMAPFRAATPVAANYHHAIQQGKSYSESKPFRIPKFPKKNFKSIPLKICIVNEEEMLFIYGVPCLTVRNM